MITATFLFTLLLLGQSQAITIKAQSEETSNKPIEIKVDPGFEVTEAKLGETKLDICVDPASSKKTVTQCYKQTIESTVKFIIADKSQWEKAEFMVGNEAKATATMQELVPLGKTGTTAGQDNKIQKDAYPLTFVPTGMRLTPKKNTPGGQPQQPPQPGGAHTEEGSGKRDEAQAGATDPVPVEKNCSEQLTAAENCFEVVTAKYPVFVLAEMSSTPQVLTLTGAGDKEFKTTFFQGSAAAWLSHSAALILANLAILYLAY